MCSAMFSSPQPVFLFHFALASGTSLRARAADRRTKSFTDTFTSRSWTCRGMWGVRREERRGEECQRRSNTLTDNVRTAFRLLRKILEEIIKSET